jgi:hypothetical protein
MSWGKKNMTIENIDDVDRILNFFATNSDSMNLGNFPSLEGRI